MRIAFIGAGSVIFTQKLIGDILGFAELRGVTLALHDIDPERLRVAGSIARREAERCGAAPVIEEHLDRRRAIDGADVVLNMVQVGGHASTLVDFEVPARFGLPQTIADTLGIGGIFRALRTIPVMQQVAADMHDVSNDAWLLNYTNPMAALTWATYAGTQVTRVVGLCHSVQYTVRDLASIIGISETDVRFLGAGVNHQAFLLRLEHATTGVSLYPLLDAALERDPDGLGRRVRMELYRRFGYFPTESSEHLAEYLPWIMRDPAEIEHYRTPVDEYVRRSEQNTADYERVRDLVDAGEPVPAAEESVEYAASIIHSLATGSPSVFYGNVRNDGFITNLPGGACVEVPCLVDGLGVHPTTIGDLPPQLAALNRTYLNPVELTVRAAIDENPDHVRHAALLDPSTAATLSITQTHELVDALIVAHGDVLPAWLRASAPVRA
ncbi:MAG: alpha-glucosidase/alpha-galactosidase [Thermoleophilia bacterium]|nr:alpha-glucosidase/alpha-galactosidase [Thermoleophilia bacterium]